MLCSSRHTHHTQTHLLALAAPAAPIFSHAHSVLFCSPCPHHPYPSLFTFALACHPSTRYVLQLFKLADRDALGAINAKNRRMGLGFLNLELSFEAVKAKVWSAPRLHMLLYAWQLALSGLVIYVSISTGFAMSTIAALAAETAASDTAAAPSRQLIASLA